jgi:hypothetical protein
VQGFGELDVQGKATVVSMCVFVAVSALIAYATVKQLRLQKQLGKRMGLGDDPADS